MQDFHIRYGFGVDGGNRAWLWRVYIYCRRGNDNRCIMDHRGGILIAHGTLFLCPGAFTCAEAMRSIDRAYQQARAKNIPFPWEWGALDSRLYCWILCCHRNNAIDPQSCWGCGCRAIIARRRCATRLLDGGHACFPRQHTSWVCPTIIWWWGTPTRT